MNGQFLFNSVHGLKFKDQNGVIFKLPGIHLKETTIFDDLVTIEYEFTSSLGPRSLEWLKLNMKGVHFTNRREEAAKAHAQFIEAVKAQGVAEYKAANGIA